MQYYILVIPLVVVSTIELEQNACYNRLTMHKARFKSDIVPSKRPNQSKEPECIIHYHNLADPGPLTLIQSPPSS